MVLDRGAETFFIKLFRTLCRVFKHLKIKINKYLWLKNMERNWVFATNPNFLTPIYLQPNYVNLWYSILWLFDITESLKYLRSTTSWLLRYRDLKIRVCCRDSIPFETLRFNLNGVWFTEILILWSIYSTLRIKDLSQRNWVSVTNSDFVIPIALQPVVVLYLDISNYEFC